MLLIYYFCVSFIALFTFILHHSSPPAGWSFLFISVSAGGSCVDFILFKWTWWGGSVIVNVYDLAAIVSVKLVKFPRSEWRASTVTVLGLFWGFFPYFFMLVIKSFNLILLGCTCISIYISLPHVIMNHSNSLLCLKGPQYPCLAAFRIVIPEWKKRWYLQT